jgi:hypothetical protein
MSENELHFFLKILLNKQHKVNEALTLLSSNFSSR